MKHPIHLSQAHITDLDVAAVTRAVRSGWIAPLGPEVDAFEDEMCHFTGVDHAVALSSGTAALHLGLLALGVGPGDEVIVPTLTFGATAFAVTYTGARPIFLDVEGDAWGLDPILLAEVLRKRESDRRRTAAIIPVDLFGRPADYDALLPVAAKYGVDMFVDAAESLGARHGDVSTGSIGRAATFSFNGNKIMTTSGGGMLVSNDPEIARKVRYRATQSREPLPWYEHKEIGYNHRLSNILAALGRAQLARLPEMIDRRRAIRSMYTDLLRDLPGITITPDPPWGSGNSWLTTVTFDLEAYPHAPKRVREALAEERIESRPTWKPMHQQPVFRGYESHLSGVADRIFEEGLCLPSGVGMSDSDVERVAGLVRTALHFPAQ